jgi:hypothetical protein
MRLKRASTNATTFKQLWGSYPALVKIEGKAYHILYKIGKILNHFAIRFTYAN